MASRMESNGVPGRIHVSQATADELTARGKQAWLVPRRDKIVAKGKGEVQTYFINVGSAQSTMTGARSTTSSDDVLDGSGSDLADLEQRLTTRNNRNTAGNAPAIEE